MKPIQLYQCEICGIQYKDKDTAINCEMSHVLPVKIVGYKYLTYNSKNSPNLLGGGMNCMR